MACMEESVRVEKVTKWFGSGVLTAGGGLGSWQEGFDWSEVWRNKMRKRNEKTSIHKL